MPKKPSISDVARLSGVSKATVDRVLNGRAHVREATVKRVNDAIRDLNYAPSALDRRVPSAGKNVDIFLSEGHNPFFAELWQAFETALGEISLTEPAVRLIGFNPYDETSLLDALAGRRDALDALVVVGVDTPRVRIEINAISAAGVTVITAVSDVFGTSRDAYAGLDNFAAGRTAGRLMSALVPRRAGTFVVLIGHLQFRHLMDRYAGFRQVLKQRAPDFNVVLSDPYGTDKKGVFDSVGQLGNLYPDLAGVYLLGAGNPSIYQALDRLHEANVPVIAHELTPLSRKALERGHIDAVIAQDSLDVARGALRCAFGLAPEPPVCEIRIFMAENLPPADMRGLRGRRRA